MLKGGRETRATTIKKYILQLRTLSKVFTYQSPFLSRWRKPKMEPKQKPVRGCACSVVVVRKIYFSETSFQSSSLHLHQADHWLVRSKWFAFPSNQYLTKTIARRLTGQICRLNNVYITFNTFSFTALHGETLGVISAPSLPRPHYAFAFRIIRSVSHKGGLACTPHLRWLDLVC